MIRMNTNRRVSLHTNVYARVRHVLFSIFPISKYRPTINCQIYYSMHSVAPRIRV